MSFNSFGFEGQYKSRREINLGGRRSNTADRSELIRQTQFERRRREEERQQQKAIATIQVWRCLKIRTKLHEDVRLMFELGWI